MMEALTPVTTRFRARAGARLALVIVMAGVVLFGAPRPAGAAPAGTIELVSHTAVGPSTTPVGETGQVISSSNGAFVVFTATATNLVAGQSDGNGGTDVFLFNRATGAVTLVSHAAGSASTAANGASSSPSISADGSFVAFHSEAANLVTGQSDTNGGTDVFLFQRSTGAVTLVSHTSASATTAGNRASYGGELSGDAGFVAFSSKATNLVAGQSDVNDGGDPLFGTDVFLFQRSTGAVTLVSHTPASATATADRSSWVESIGANGAFVAFVSRATNLVPGQTDHNEWEFVPGTDVFLYDRSAGAVSLVSHTPASTSTTGNVGSDAPSISADGAFIAFTSDASDLVASQSDPNGALNGDVFLYNRATAAVTLVSHASTSTTTTADGHSCCPSISRDGAFVAFLSSATNLVAGQSDANGGTDVFLFQRSTGAVTLVSHTPASTTTSANRTSHDASISADGAFVAFESSATNLVAGQNDGNSVEDVFLFHRSTGAVSLVSHTPGSKTTTGNAASDRPSISADGDFVAFHSSATNLVTGQSDANGTYDVFLFQRKADVVPPADFDGNGSTDIAVYRPSNSTWFVRGGSTVSWGTSRDIPVPGDYNGDGTTDRAVFRPSSGTWFVHGGAAAAFGTSGDIPVPGDYNGDGTTDMAVFRPSSGTWFIRSVGTFSWGTSGDIPVPADYDGDGDTDVAVYRPSSRTWFVRSGTTVAWGTTGDIPVPADYDGDGDAEIAVFRPASGTWFVHGGTAVAFGTSGDIPVPGDYNGDGRADRGVFRPSNGYWFVHGGAVTQFGTSGDVPLPLPDAVRRFFFPPL